MPLPSEIQLVPLDFDTIRTDLRRFLQSQDLLKDYNFEGSALTTLFDVLAYDAYYHGWYTNFAVNEVFLHTAQIRNSVVAAARQLGYTPRSVTSAVAYVDITVNGVSTTEGSIFLNQYTPFTSTISGNTYTFYTIAGYTLPTLGKTSITFPSVEIYEGKKIQESLIITPNLISNTGTAYKISDSNIDTRTLRVSVKPDVSSPTVFQYTKATSALTVTPTSNVYFLFESNDGNYEIQFGDGNLGRNLAPGNQVILEYLVSRGEEGNGARTFSYAGSAIGLLSQSSDVTIALNNPNIPSLGGTTRESIDSIKRTAPEIYQVQGRIVTPADARATLLSEYNGIDSLSVWGGEDNDTPTYGKMFIALKPVNADKFGTLQKEAIVRNILRPKSIPTLTYELLDPDYVYVIVNSEVRYSQAFTTASASQIKNIITTAILQYGVNELNRFGGYFRYSILSKVIDESDPSIRSNISQIQLEKRVTVNATSGVYTLNFGNPLLTVPNQPSMDMIVVTSKVGTQRFVHAGLAGELRSNCYIENRGTAVNLYRDIEEYSVQGRPQIVQYLVKSNIGSVDFKTGKVILRRFFPSQITTSQFSELKIRAIPLNADLQPTRAQIIRIVEDTVNVRIIEDTVSRTNTLTGIGSGFNFGV